MQDGLFVESKNKKKAVHKNNKRDLANVGIKPILHTDMPVHCLFFIMYKEFNYAKPDKATGSLALLQAAVWLILNCKEIKYGRWQCNSNILCSLTCKNRVLCKYHIINTQRVYSDTSIRLMAY